MFGKNNLSLHPQRNKKHEISKRKKEEHKGSTSQEEKIKGYTEDRSVERGEMQRLLFGTSPEALTTTASLSHLFSVAVSDRELSLAVVSLWPRPLPLS